MIVTRRWLEEFISLDGVDDQQLHNIFNSIGLEVDSMQHFEMPQNVVVGKILSCGKHPDADKLNLCLVDVGEDEPVQIICGASNVRDAQYVAVAKVGAILPGDFAIKPAKLRGLDSFGMICSSSELGLPNSGDGIMILDESIGKLISGKPLSDYPDFNDTVIELELTANRGDCLSIRGVARDLSAVLDREIERLDIGIMETLPLGIARMLELRTKGRVDADLYYSVIEKKQLPFPFLMRLRLAMVDALCQETIDSYIAYTIHSTGVILRAYDANRLRDDDGKISLEISQEFEGYVKVSYKNESICIVGVSCNRDYLAKDDSVDILLETSYINPNILVPAVAKMKPKSDELYYRTSRGSEADLLLGLEYLQNHCKESSCLFSETPLKVESRWEALNLSIDIPKLYSIIGQEIPKGTIYTILQRLGFEVYRTASERFRVKVPRWRHDISNIQDIAEEILRIVGINQIEAKPLEIVEKNQLTKSTLDFKVRRDLRQRAVSAGFFEAVTYAFANRRLLEEYNFPILDSSHEILNPIVEEFNTLRSTLILNLLESAKRNVNYGKRRIPLFEIGSAFDKDRQETLKVSFLWSGEFEVASVLNQGKPAKIDFSSFVQKLSSIIGEFSLKATTQTNGVIHPYQSADVYKNGNYIGWLSKVHPKVCEAFDLEDTFIAEFNFDGLIPKHIDARAISNFQGTFKDLSLLVDRELAYEEMYRVLESLDEPLLNRFFAIDRYEDEQLNNQKSMTIRFFLQSQEGTLMEEEIDGIMNRILKSLEKECGANLR